MRSSDTEAAMSAKECREDRQCCFCHQPVSSDSALGPFSFRQGEKFCHLLCAMFSNGVWLDTTLIDLSEIDRNLYVEAIKPLMFFPSLDFEYTQQILQTVMPCIMNVEDAIIRSGNTKCSRCKKLGASIKCNRRDCKTTCHYQCIHRLTSGNFN